MTDICPRCGGYSVTDGLDEYGRYFSCYLCGHDFPLTETPDWLAREKARGKPQQREVRPQRKLWAGARTWRPNE